MTSTNTEPKISLSLAFIIGALFILVLIVAGYFAYQDGMFSDHKSIDIHIQAPNFTIPAPAPAPAPTPPNG